jgi:hypothetical protein
MARTKNTARKVTPPPAAAARPPVSTALNALASSDLLVVRLSGVLAELCGQGNEEELLCYEVGRCKLTLSD